MFGKKVKRNCIASAALSVFAGVTAARGNGVVFNSYETTPGNVYQIVFVTSDTIDATSNLESTYNNLATTDAAPLTSILPNGTTWSAITSTPTEAAINNAPTFASIPIYNTLGQFVAYGGTGSGGIFDQSANPVLADAIQTDENGNAYSGFVWSGSNADGSIAGSSAMGGHENGPNQFSVAGQTPTYLDPGWINCGAFLDQGNDYPVYALSSPITATPEPAGLMLIGIAGMGLGLRRRRVAV